MDQVKVTDACNLSINESIPATGNRNFERRGRDLEPVRGHDISACEPGILYEPVFDEALGGIIAGKQIDPRFGKH